MKALPKLLIGLSKIGESANLNVNKSNWSELVKLTVTTLLGEIVHNSIEEEQRL